MRKIIVTGSAPYLPVWWENNKDKLTEYEVHSINTSILITKDVCKRWWYSNDFFNNMHPEINPNIVPPEVHIIPSLEGEYLRPYIDYVHGNTPETEGGTMLFNVIRHLYNENVKWNNIEEVNIIGCDLIYKDGEQNHFYGTGTNDPLRLGLDNIRENIEMFKQEYKKANVKLYNLSLQKESLLTFDRRIL